MSSADGPGADPNELGQEVAFSSAPVHTQLVEALMLSLIEKGVLTKNDALNIVQTVAQVQQGTALEDTVAGPQSQANLQMLRRMYASFEALADGTRVGNTNWQNVLRLRPPIHGDHPEFPQED